MCDGSHCEQPDRGTVVIVVWNDVVPRGDVDWLAVFRECFFSPDPALLSVGTANHDRIFRCTLACIRTVYSVLRDSPVPGSTTPPIIATNRSCRPTHPDRTLPRSDPAGTWDDCDS